MMIKDDAAPLQPRKAPIVALVLMLGLSMAAASWWLLAPAHAVARLQHAALSGYPAAVVERVDFPALRTSLKTQLKARLLAEARPDRHPLAAAGTNLALAFIDPMVDAAVTPETLRAAMAASAEWTAPAALAAIGTLAVPDLAIARDGLDRFTLRPARSGASPALVFCRDGFDFDLCGVELSRTA